MKKIFLILVIASLSTMLFLHPRETVNAEIIDITDFWEYYIPVGDTYYNIDLWIQLTANTGELTINLPASNTLKTSYDGDNAYLEFSGLDFTTIILPLSDYTDFTGAETIVIDFSTGIFDTHSITGATYFRIEIETALTTFGAQEMQWWYLTFLPNATVTLEDTMIEVRYYVQGTLTYVDYIYDDLPINQVPDSITGKVFIGWKVASGSLFDFGGYIDPLLLAGVDNNILNLYAYYVAGTIIDNTVVAPVSTAPVFLTDFMTGLNANNEVGYTLLYFVGLVLIIVSFLIFHSPIFPIVVVTFVWSVAFIVMQVLPIFLIVIMVILYVIILIKTLSLTSESEV